MLFEEEKLQLEQFQKLNSLNQAYTYIRETSNCTSIFVFIDYNRSEHMHT